MPKLADLRKEFSSLVPEGVRQYLASREIDQDSASSALQRAVADFNEKLAAHEDFLSVDLIEDFELRVIPDLENLRAVAYVNLQRKYTNIDELFNAGKHDKITRASLADLEKQIKFVQAIPAVEALQQQMEGLTALSESLQEAASFVGDVDSLPKEAVSAFAAIRNEVEASAKVVEAFSSELAKDDQARFEALPAWKRGDRLNAVKAVVAKEVARNLSVNAKKVKSAEEDSDKAQAKIAEKEQALNKRREKISEQEKELEGLEKELKEQRAQLETKRQELSGEKESVSSKTVELANIDEDLKVKQGLLPAKETDLQKKETDLAARKKQDAKPWRRFVRVATFGRVYPKQNFSKDDAAINTSKLEIATIKSDIEKGESSKISLKDAIGKSESKVVVLEQDVKQGEAAIGDIERKIFTIKNGANAVEMLSIRTESAALELEKAALADKRKSIEGLKARGEEIKAAQDRVAAVNPGQGQDGAEFKKMASQVADFSQAVATNADVVASLEAQDKRAESTAEMKVNVAKAMQDTFAVARAVKREGVFQGDNKTAKVASAMSAAADFVPLAGTALQATAALVKFLNERKRKERNENVVSFGDDTGQDLLEEISAKVAAAYSSNPNFVGGDKETRAQIVGKVVKKMVSGIKEGKIPEGDNVTDAEVIDALLKHALDSEKSTKIGPKKELKLKEKERDVKYTVEGATNRQGIIVEGADGKKVTLTTKDRQEKDEAYGSLKYGAREATPEEQAAYDRATKKGDSLDGEDSLKNYAEFIPLKDRLEKKLEDKVGALMKSGKVKIAGSEEEVRNAVVKVVDDHQKRLSAGDKGADAKLKEDLSKVIELGSRSGVRNKEYANRAAFNDVKGLIDDLATNNNSRVKPSNTGVKPDHSVNSLVKGLLKKGAKSARAVVEVVAGGSGR